MHQVPAVPRDDREWREGNPPDWLTEATDARDVCIAGPPYSLRSRETGRGTYRKVEVAAQHMSRVTATMTLAPPRTRDAAVATCNPRQWRPL
jgi:hypothetical protein